MLEGISGRMDGFMKKRLLSAAAMLVIIAVLAVYLSNGYDASAGAQRMMEKSTDLGHAHAFVPKETRAGLIFYPGGKVDHAAYAPLMLALQERGILALLVEMPLDLAVLDMNAADGLQAMYPDVERWMIGGHSLGGAMAAGYVNKHAQDYEALVLLGAYSAADLSDTALSVLSIYGTQDGVLNRQKYEECRKNYPEGLREVVLEGGCHANFGDYGAQKGDGVPTISREEQLKRTADAIAAMLE